MSSAMSDRDDSRGSNRDNDRKRNSFPAASWMPLHERDTFVEAKLIRSRFAGDYVPDFLTTSYGLFDRAITIYEM